MNKQFKKVKMFMLLVILFCSLLFIIGPTAASGPLDSYFECEPVIIIEYNESILQDPVVPYEVATRIPIEIKARIKGPGDDIVSDYLWNKEKQKGKFLPVKLFIEEVPEGCHATINPPLLELKPIHNEFSTIHANVTLTVDKRLPALQQEKIIIRVKTARLGNTAAILKPGNVTLEMPFFIGYYPQISISTPEGNVKEVHPDETAEFPIELQNFGNGNTEVTSEITEVPEGWFAKIITTTLLGSENVGGDPKETITLKVRPPISFGYHEEREIIKVTITPSYYKNSEYAGEPHYLFFVVQSRGFSTPGFDFITLLFAFSLISLFIFRKKQLKRRGL